MIAQLDWSQNHAASAPDAHDARKMLVGNTGSSAKHVRSTCYPVPISKVRGVSVAVPRALECRLNCAECRAAREGHTVGLGGEKIPNSTNPNWQAIGKKGLWIVCEERGKQMYNANGKRKVQEELVLMLEQDDDFSPKLLHEKSHVFEMMRDRGHCALFGVKYHAELAHVERKWMWLKNKIRPELNAKMPKLQELLKQAWSLYTIENARKDARHCRGSMAAYRTLHEKAAAEGETGEVQMSGLKAAETVEYNSHRCVFASNDTLLRIGADMASEVTETEKARAELTVRRREKKAERAEKRKAHEKDMKAEERRRAHAAKKAKNAPNAGAATAGVEKGQRSIRSMFKPV